MSTDRPNEDIRLRIQALVDNELPEEEIDSVLAEIQGSYEYRSEYVELLQLKRKLAGRRPPELAPEWIDRAERRISRRISRSTGSLLFIGSYVALFGYAIFSLFGDPEVPLTVSVLVACIVAGFVVLLGGAIADRIRESRTDKYKDVIR